MSTELYQGLVKWISIGLALVIAAGLVYRGNTYSDPNGPGMLVPVMCVLSALSLIGTTLAMFLKPREAY